VQLVEAGEGRRAAGIDLRSEPTLAKLADLRLHGVHTDAEFRS
jgi:hypothetical protein